MEKYLDINKNDTKVKSFIAIDYFSIKFCFQICSMLLHHIDQGKKFYLFIYFFRILCIE